jgi:hypothetical protein
MSQKWFQTKISEAPGVLLHHCRSAPIAGGRRCAGSLPHNQDRVLPKDIYSSMFFRIEALEDDLSEEF